MSIKLQNIFFFTFGLFLLILIIFHSRLFGIENMIVSGNYEFSKVSIFNIIFPVFFLIHYVLFFRKIKIKKNIFFGVLFFYCILFLSTVFSEVMNNSLFGGNSKGHGFFFWNNLILIFLYFYFGIQKFGKEIFEKIFLIGGIIILFFGFKELIFPSFEYGVLGTRMLSTFGHPNYVAAYFVLLIPYIFFQEKNYCKKNLIRKKYLYNVLFLLFGIGIFLTKSAIAIALFLIFIIIQIKKISPLSKIFFLLILGIIGCVALFFIAPEKFSSFISRYYIWETSFKILFSDIKIFFLGIGNENLGYFFNNFKSPELYLYERFGYFASRGHNIFIDFWLNFGIIGCIFFIGIISKIYKNFDIKKYYFFSLLGGIIFWSFHFPNIIGSVFFVFLLSLFFHENNQSQKYISGNIFKIFFSITCIFGILGSYFSYNFYQAEVHARKGNIIEAQNLFPYKAEYFLKNMQMDDALKAENNFYSEKYLTYAVYYASNTLNACDNLLDSYSTVENYFFCGKRIEKKYDFETAKKYYQQGLNKFPDIFSENNPYLHNYPGKYIINVNHVLHEKFSDIQIILKKLQE